MLVGTTSKLLNKSGAVATLGWGQALLVPFLESSALVSALFGDHEQYPPWALVTEMVIVLAKLWLCCMFPIGQYGSRSIPNLISLYQGRWFLKTTFPRLPCIWLGSANVRTRERLAGGRKEARVFLPLSRLWAWASLAVAVLSPLLSQLHWEVSTPLQPLDSRNHLLPLLRQPLGNWQLNTLESISSSPTCS